MADIDITQAEADALIAMEKQCAEDKRWLFPGPGDRVSVPLVSLDRRENFLLDIARGAIKLTKVTYQNRARQAIVLLRLDIDGAPHTNPELSAGVTLDHWVHSHAGEKVPCPHLHIYIEGYGDKWAIPAPAGYSNAADLFTAFEWFMRQCNITKRPYIEKGLFS